jgi:hypothetical protein
MWPLRIAVATLEDLVRRVGIAKRTIDYRLHLEEHFVPRPDDVIVCGYPRSGISVIQMLFFQMMTKGDLSTISHMSDFAPWFEILVSTSPRSLDPLPSPRIVKSFATAGALPELARKIYILRHPVDVAVSEYRFILLYLRSTQLRDHVDRFIAGRSDPRGSWYDHVRSWWRHRSDPNVLTLRYEEVTRDLADAARRVARFAGVPLHEADLPRIVERCSFSFMKEHQRKFDHRGFGLPPDAVAHLEGDYFNEGRSGTGLAMLSADQRRRLARKLASLARRLDVSPSDPWADLFQLP